MATVYSKILKVMADVKHLKKDDTVSYKTTSYKGISEEHVTKAVRAAMIKHGLVMLPVKINHEMRDIPTERSLMHLSIMDNEYDIVDADTGESVRVMASGAGVDTQDKSPGKAQTYAGKYALLKAFLIPTGDDPDRTASAETDDAAGRVDYPAMLRDLARQLKKKGRDNKYITDALEFVQPGAKKAEDLTVENQKALVKEFQAQLKGGGK